jgi:hypothetical protein
MTVVPVTQLQLSMDAGYTSAIDAATAGTDIIETPKMIATMQHKLAERIKAVMRDEWRRPKVQRRQGEWQAADDVAVLLNPDPVVRVHRNLQTIVDSSGVSLLIMPTVTLKIRPVQSWTSSDETSLLQVLGSLEYEPFASDDADSPVRHFQTQKLLPNDLWAESNSVLESLIPRLYCLVKFELTTESAKVSRWTQVTGQPWFDSEDGRF